MLCLMFFWNTEVFLKQDSSNFPEWMNIFRYLQMLSIVSFMTSVWSDKWFLNQEVILLKIQPTSNGGWEAHLKTVSQYLSPGKYICMNLFHFLRIVKSPSKVNPTPYAQMTYWRGNSGYLRTWIGGVVNDFWKGCAKSYFKKVRISQTPASCFSTAITFSST